MNYFLLLFCKFISCEWISFTSTRFLLCNQGRRFLYCFSSCLRLFFFLFCIPSRFDDLFDFLKLTRDNFNAFFWAFGELFILTEWLEDLLKSASFFMLLCSCGDLRASFANFCAKSRVCFCSNSLSTRLFDELDLFMITSLTLVILFLSQTLLLSCTSKGSFVDRKTDFSAFALSKITLTSNGIIMMSLSQWRRIKKFMHIYIYIWILDTCDFCITCLYIVNFCNINFRDRILW